MNYSDKIDIMYSNKNNHEYLNSLEYSIKEKDISDNIEV